jgi:hypothetical protein
MIMRKLNADSSPHTAELLFTIENLKVFLNYLNYYSLFFKFET